MTEVSTNLIRTHRFGLSISGGVALGSYEAGVLCQLYRDLAEFNAHQDIVGKAQVRIDAIAGASAGSITGLILAQAIGSGATPDTLEARMRACWIDLLEIHNLLGPSGKKEVEDSLFTGAVVDKIVHEALQIPPPAPPQPQEPIALWITMTNLDGIPFVIDFKRKDEHHAQTNTQLYALDYRDYIPFLIEGSTIRMIADRMVLPVAQAGEAPAPEATWDAAVAAARASSAFPIAFPSQRQQRNLEQYPEYVKFRQAVIDGTLPDKSGQAGLQQQTALPSEATFQFVDGGLFNNEPIGKCIDAVNDLNERYPSRNPNSAESAGQVGRSFIIIEPEPQLPADVEQALTMPTTAHAHSTLPTAMLGKILSAYFNSALYGDFKTVAQTNDQIRALDAALADLDALGLPAEAAEALKTKIREAVGLNDKTAITLQRIPHELTSSKRLAGAFGGHFGGFLRKDFREADFITGQHEARQWLVHWLMLWLTDHCTDVGKRPDEIEAFVQTLFAEDAPSPQTTRIPPHNLTPLELANSGWFPDTEFMKVDPIAARDAALTEQERAAIVRLAEARGELLLNHWFQVSPLVHLGVHLAVGALEHLFNDRFIKVPEN